MYRLYIAHGTSALAAHIMLEEIGLPYETHALSMADKAHLTPEYRAINPRGRVPALVTPQGVVVENPAILAYLGQSHPEKNLVPVQPFAFAQAQSINMYLAATLHVAFAHKARGARWADSPDAIEALKEKVPQTVAEGAQFVEDHLIKGPWVLGEDFSFCDPYVFLVHRWLELSGISLAGYPKLRAHTDAMRARPAVAHVMAQHNL